MTPDAFAAGGSPGGAVARGLLGGRWLFGAVFAAQVGHLIEHVAVAIQGRAFLGSAFDSEFSHLLFNGLVAVSSVALVITRRRNPWVYPLVVLAVFHGVEHVYIFHLYVQTGVTAGPGLLGIGGAIGIIPLARLDLHNVYNGLEIVLMVLGLWHEATETLLLEAG